MTHYLITAISQKFKSLMHYFQEFCVSNIVEQHSLPAFPDIEWELTGDRYYRHRAKLLARFFFLLGCVILAIAICVYLWQSPNEF